jgi:hypothetical protein
MQRVKPVRTRIICHQNNEIKVLIKKLIKYKITPSVQTSINNKYEIYYLSSNLDFLYENVAVAVVYNQLVSCVYDYPERNVHLIGYYNDEIVYDKIINYHE